VSAPNEMRQRAMSAPRRFRELERSMNGTKELGPQKRGFSSGPHKSSVS
jgi:hypothetical protein